MSIEDCTCGGTAVLRKTLKRVPEISIHCTQCGANLTFKGITDAEIAIEFWNDAHGKGASYGEEKTES